MNGNLSNVEIDWNQVWKAGVYGAITSGVMSGCQGLGSLATGGINIVFGDAKFNVTSISELSALATKYKGQSLTDSNVKAEFFSDLKALSDLNKIVPAGSITGHLETNHESTVIEIVPIQL